MRYHLDIAEALRLAGVQPSAQRLAIAQYVLATADHPSADEVLQLVRRGFPMVSRATVYNTLNLLVRSRLLRALTIAEGRVVFDPNIHPHHHFVDDDTGKIYDIPWEQLQIQGQVSLPGYEVSQYMVVLRGRKLGRTRKVGAPVAHRLSRRAHPPKH